MTRRYVVIGSNSFSGSHFVARLLAEGYEVLGLSRSPEVGPVFAAYNWDLHRGSFKFTQVDMNDAASLASALHAFKPSVVVNFASQSMVAESWRYPSHWYQTNVVGIVKLAQELETLHSLEKYVHISTPEVYGSTEEWVTESEGFKPSTPYAISRAAADMHLMAMHRERGFPVCFTRAANVYGPGQQLYRIVPRALLSARLGRILPLDGGGTSTRSFIYISDVVDATLNIAEGATTGETFHISNDSSVSIRRLVEMICEKTNVPLTSLIADGPERLGKDSAYLLDSNRLRTSFGWSPKVTLDDGLERTLGWVVENLSELSQLPVSYAHRE